MAIENLALRISSTNIYIYISLSLSILTAIFKWTWVRQYHNVSILDFTGATYDGGGEW